MSGEGEIHDLDNDSRHAINAGTLYILNKHDRHQLKALSEMKMACVFNPPLTGAEVHNKDGAYELPAC